MAQRGLFWQISCSRVNTPMSATQSSLRAISTPASSFNENKSSHCQSHNDTNLQLTMHQWRIQCIEAVSLPIHRPIALPLAGASRHFQLISRLVDTASCQTDTQFHPDGGQNFWKWKKFWVLFWETLFRFVSFPSSRPSPLLFFSSSSSSPATNYSLATNCS